MEAQNKDIYTDFKKHKDENIQRYDYEWKKVKFLVNLLRKKLCLCYWLIEVTNAAEH